MLEKYKLLLRKIVAPLIIFAATSLSMTLGGCVAVQENSNYDSSEDTTNVTTEVTTTSATTQSDTTSPEFSTTTTENSTTSQNISTSTSTPISTAASDNSNVNGADYTTATTTLTPAPTNPPDTASPEISSSVSDNSSAASSSVSSATSAVTNITSGSTSATSTKPVDETVASSVNNSTYSYPEDSGLFFPYLDSDKIVRAVYSPEVITPDEYYYYYDNVTIRQLSQLVELLSILSNIGYEEVSRERINTESVTFKAWEKENPDMTVLPESLTFYDNLGNELYRFESDTRAALVNGRDTRYFSRLFIGNKQYVLASGSIYRNGIVTIATNQTLLNNGFLTIEVLSEIARTQVSEYLHSFESIDPFCEIYSPNTLIITIEGEVLTPLSFDADERLCDCTFYYPDGNKMIVTLNAATGKVYQIKIEAAPVY